MSLAQLSTTHRPVDPRRTAEYHLDAETQELLSQLIDCDDECEESRLRNEIIVRNLALAERLATRYTNRGIATDDLIQVAYLALVRAVAAFDPLRPETFVGFLVLSIRGDLKKQFRDHAWAIRPPRRLQELHLELKSELSAMAQENGAVPTQRALAHRLRAPERDISEAMILSGCFAPASLDRQTHQGADADTLADRIPAVDDSMNLTEIRLLLTPLLADLPLRERRLVHLRFYREWTQTRIAEELGVSQMQISRILRRVLMRLRATLEGQLAAG